MPNRFKLVGGVLVVAAVVNGARYVTTFNDSVVRESAMVYGGGMPVLIFGGMAMVVATGIIGVVLLAADPPPRLFQQLSQNGLIVFVILAAILPILCWLPWLIPGLKHKDAQS